MSTSEAESRPPARVVHEDGCWAAFLPGTPLAGTAGTRDGAIRDLVDAMRDYADDWDDRLQEAPNHADWWALVQLVRLNDNEGLRDWLLAG